MSTFLFVSGTELDKGCKTGAHRRFVELIQGLSKNNRILLISGKIPQLLMNSNITHNEIVVGKIGRLPHSFSALYHMVKGIKRYSVEGYDYAISFSRFQTLAYILCGKKNIVTLLREDIIEYQNVIYNQGLKLTLRNFYQYILETIVVMGSKAIIVQCKADYDNLLKRHKVLAKKLEKKLSIQINNIASWMCRDEGDEDVSKASDITTIAFVGGFNDRRKGHEILFPAVEKLLKDGVKVRLLIAGDGKFLEKEKEKYASYNEFVFLGRVQNMDDMYAQTDFAVVPSLQDSCPNTVLEALAYGVPVYGANAGGIPDLLVNREYLFEPNTDDLYEFLKKNIMMQKFTHDRIQQHDLRQQLQFDWCYEIKTLCESICGSTDV